MVNGRCMTHSDATPSELGSQCVVTDRDTTHSEQRSSYAVRDAECSAHSVKDAVPCAPTPAPGTPEKHASFFVRGPQGSPPRDEQRATLQVIRSTVRCGAHPKIGARCWKPLPAAQGYALPRLVRRNYLRCLKHDVVLACDACALDFGLKETI